MKAIVQIIGTTAGGPSPYDNKWVVAWNPHTPFGIADLRVTEDPVKARVFDDPVSVMKEWRTVSVVQELRPDGKPNRPLTGLSIMIQNPENMLNG